MEECLMLIRFDPKPSLTERNGEPLPFANRNLNSLRPVISLRLPGNFVLMERVWY